MSCSACASVAFTSKRTLSWEDDCLTENKIIRNIRRHNIYFDLSHVHVKKTSQAGGQAPQGDAHGEDTYNSHCSCQLVMFVMTVNSSPSSPR